MTEKTKRGKFRILCDEVKQAHTSHWDMDYLSREDLDRVFGKTSDAASTTSLAEGKDKPKSSDGD